MLHLIKFTSILIVWSLVILYLNKKDSLYENFYQTSTPPPTTDNVYFDAWGKTKLGCINRCILFKTNNDNNSDQNLSHIEINTQCTNSCKECTSDNCEWSKSSMELNNNQNNNNNNFKIQTISGDNNAVLKWTYYNTNELNKINVSDFNIREDFYLIQKPLDTLVKFEFKEKEKDNDEDYDKYTSNGYEIYKNKNENENNLEKNNWYIKKIDKTNSTSTPSDSKVQETKICNNETHPLNSKWENTEWFYKFKKVDDIEFEMELKNFIIQLVDAKNPDTGIKIYKYKEDSEKTSELLNPEKNIEKMYKKEIKNLEPNRDYKLSIYPIFIKTNNINPNIIETVIGNDYTSEIILLSTKEFTVINK